MVAWRAVLQALHFQLSIRNRQWILVMHPAWIEAKAASEVATGSCIRSIRVCNHWCTRTVTTQTNGNVLIVTIDNCCIKVMRAVSRTKPTAKHIARVRFDPWVYPFGILTYKLSDIWPQFICTVLKKLCLLLEVELLITNTDHPQTEGPDYKVRQHISYMIAPLGGVAPKNCYMYVQALKYARNMQTSRARVPQYSTSSSNASFHRPKNSKSWSDTRQHELKWATSKNRTTLTIWSEHNEDHNRATTGPCVKVTKEKTQNEGGPSSRF